MFCQYCGAENHDGWTVCIDCGEALPLQGDNTGGVIPYKNPQALTAYYLGLFSILPVIGFFLGIAAFFLGISGLKKRKANPVIKGSVHAWVGIGCGGLMAIVWGLSIMGFVFSLVGGF